MPPGVPCCARRIRELPEVPLQTRSSATVDIRFPECRTQDVAVAQSLARPDVGDRLDPLRFWWQAACEAGTHRPRLAVGFPPDDLQCVQCSRAGMRMIDDGQGPCLAEAETGIAEECLGRCPWRVNERVR